MPKAQKETNLIDIKTDDYIDQALKSFSITDSAIQKMADDYMPLTIESVDDKQGYELVRSARLTVKATRVAVDKRRKELTADALKIQRGINEEAKRITSILEPIENHLQTMETNYDEEVEAIKMAKLREAQRIKDEADRAKQIKINERIARLTKYGFIFTGTYWQATINDISCRLSVDQVNETDDEENEIKFQKFIAEVDLHYRAAVIKEEMKIHAANVLAKEIEAIREAELLRQKEEFEANQKELKKAKAEQLKKEKELKKQQEELEEANKALKEKMLAIEKFHQEEMDKKNQQLKDEIVELSGIQKPLSDDEEMENSVNPRIDDFMAVELPVNNVKIGDAVKITTDVLEKISQSPYEIRQAPQPEIKINYRGQLLTFCRQALHENATLEFIQDTAKGLLALMGEKI